METPNYLHLRTTNINIRISPLLKSALIERGAKMGLNLSDYIMHILTMEMNEDRRKTCEKCPPLEERVQKLQIILDRYEQLSQQFRGLIGKNVTINDESYRISETYDIFWLMSQTFKTRES